MKKIEIGRRVSRPRQSNIVWPCTFEKEVKAEGEKVIVRSDKGRKWMKRLELRKRMRTNASYVLNPEVIPSVPKRTSSDVRIYDSRRITNNLLRERMCKQIVVPLSTNGTTTTTTIKLRRRRRRRRRNKQQQEQKKLTPREKVSKRLDEIFTVKTCVVSPKSKKSLPLLKPDVVSPYRVMASRMENIWSVKKNITTFQN